MSYVNKEMEGFGQRGKYIDRAREKLQPILRGDCHLLSWRSHLNPLVTSYITYTAEGYVPMANITFSHSWNKTLIQRGFAFLTRDERPLYVSRWMRLSVNYIKKIPIQQLHL